MDVLPQRRDLRVGLVAPDERRTVVVAHAGELLVVQAGDAEDRQLELLLQFGPVDDIAACATHLDEPVNEVRLNPLLCEVVACLRTLSQRGVARQLQALLNLRSLQHVRLCGDENQRAVGAVHQQLLPKIVVEHVLGGFVVDRSVDVADDPDRVRAL